MKRWVFPILTLLLVCPGCTGGSGGSRAVGGEEGEGEGKGEGEGEGGSEGEGEGGSEGEGEGGSEGEGEAPLSCDEIVDCIPACPDGDDACPDGCYERGSPAARRLFDSMLGCWMDHCGEIEDEEALLDCIERHCAAETIACLDDGGAEGEGEGEGEPGYTVRGVLQFQARMATVDGRGQIELGGVETMPAIGMFAGAYGENGDFLGSGVVGAQGAFSVPLSRPLAGGEMLIFATLFADDQDRLLLAVLEPTQGGYPATLSSRPWAWSIQVPASGNLGTITVTEAQGSGAMFVYLINIAAMDTVVSDALGGDTSRILSLALLWAPGIAWSCGACFAAGPQQMTDGPSLEQSIFISGESSDSSAWGWAVLLHEFGHYVAHNYSRDDSPGGAHNFGELLSPPFAWSEGWASFFAISTMSRWSGEPLPLYWDIQDGASFWIDYDSASYSYGAAMARPQPAGGLAQPLEESYVTTMLWHLWDGDEIPESSEDDGSALGTPRVMRAIGSPRFLQRDRGGAGADFVDFVDAVLCADAGLRQSVTATLLDPLGFPYDGSPVCP